MQDSILKIGEELLEGQGIWAQLATEPSYNSRKEKHWVCPILFDCVNQEIQILKDELQLFKLDQSKIDFRYLNPEKWGRNGKKCALTIEKKKLYMLEETLFGKEENDIGTMLTSMEEFDEELKGRPLYKALYEINEKLGEKRDELDIKRINKTLGLSNQDEVVLFYTKIKSEIIEHDGIVNLFELDGYEDFVIGKFATPDKSSVGLDYLTGDLSKEVVEASFTGRRNLNKVFQMTASNYATGFSDFKKNYQSSPAKLAALDKASEYFLENEITIADVPHIVVPNFLSKDLDHINLEKVEFFIDKASELLFQVNSFNESILRKLYNEKLFWINYVAFESVGNEFKIINHIKDVNNLYLQKVIQVFYKSGIDYKDYIGGDFKFNLRSIYFIIPIRDSKKRSKVNSVLTLFKDILEQQVISSQNLFSHFVKFISIHRNGSFKKGRSSAFPNIKEKELFDYALKDGVFNYLALFNALEQLNLISMKNDESTQIVNQIKTQYPNEEVDEFLNLKECSRNQVALFCLGRALNVVGYAQERKNHPSKPILNKVNFKGMDLSDSKDLYGALMEKGVQYQTVTTGNGNIFQVRSNIEKWLDLYGKYLDDEDWSLSKEEAVFYLLAGYVFKPSSKYSNKAEDDSTE